MYLKIQRSPYQLFVCNVFCNFPRWSSLPQSKPGPATPAFKSQSQAEKCKALPGLAPTHCLGILFPGISKYFHTILATSFFLYLESPSPPGILLLLRVTAAKATPCRQHPSHLFLHKVVTNITALLQLECPASFPWRQQVGNTNIF